jgi:hypothetical protein
MLWSALWLCGWLWGLAGSTSPSPPFVHIHIPKTGGIAVETYLLQHYPKKFLLTMNHNNTAAEFRDKICLIVIREPRDRFISSYQAWRYGSSLYYRGNESALASLVNLAGSESWKPPVDSIFDFIEAAGNSSHPAHGYVLDRLNATEEGRNCLDDAQTWGVHFRPQSHWLKGGARHQIVLVRYSPTPEIFSNRFFHALRHLSLPVANGTSLEPVNTSKKRASETSRSHALNSETLSQGNVTTLPRDDTALEPQYRELLLRHLRSSPWINQFYQSDFKLWSLILSDLQGNGEGRHWRAVF